MRTLLYYILVLIDPNKRPVYDQFGMKGLEIEGMEVCKFVYKMTHTAYTSS